MGHASFEVRGDPNIPLVGHVPHAGTAIPDDVRSQLTITSEELSAEIARITDHHTDRLFSSILEMGGAMLVNLLSRLVVDPERFRDDALEPMAARGAGAIYEVTSALKQLRPSPSKDQRESLLQNYFDPYSAAMADLVAEALERHGRVTIVDCHSFPTVPLDYAASSSRDRPEVCIGADLFHTPDHIVHAVLGVCENNGVQARVNDPYSGSYVPTRFFRQSREVTSIMIEIRRDMYMDEQSCEPSERWTDTRSLVDEMLQSIC